MIGEEGAELVGPPRKRQKNIGNEARFFLHRFDPLANVLRQIMKLGRRESADRRLAHKQSPVLILEYAETVFSDAHPMWWARISAFPLWERCLVGRRRPRR